MKLWATLIFYRDGVELLEKCLSSLKKNGVDDLIAVDGRYEEFPDKEDKSSNEEIRAMLKYCSFVHGRKGVWANQMEKRNASIRPVPPGDYFLIIDADEVLANPIDKSKLIEDAYSVAMFEPKPNTESSVYNVFKTCYKQYPSNRIFKKYSDMEYRNRHCALYRTSLIKNPSDVHSGLVSRDLNIPFLYNGSEPVTLYHYPYLRTPQRQLDDALYMENRTSEVKVEFRNKPKVSEDVSLVYVKFNANDELKEYNVDYGSFKDQDVFAVNNRELERLVTTYGPYQFTKVDND